MNGKKSRWLRRLTKYNPGDDPIHKRKYAVVVCNKVVIPNMKQPVRVRCGGMVINKGKRFQYRAAKKLYRRNMI